MRTIIPARTAETLITQKCNLNCTYCFETCKNNKDIDFDELIKRLTKDGQFDTFPINSFYIFGGEPLMNVEFIDRLLQWINTNKSMGQEDKSRYLETICGNLITNGTLTQKYIDFIKKNNISLQVSIDGPKDINDKNRVDFNGKGSFDRILNNLKICRENGIYYVLHGAISRNNYKDFCRINEFFLEQRLLQKDIKEPLEDFFYKNYAQIIFEDNINDEDINILLDQFYQTVKMILTTPLLNNFSYKTRKDIAIGFLNRRGGWCSAGNTMYSYDDELNVFPCHRINTDSHNKINRFMSLTDESITINYAYYEQFQLVLERKEMYGAYLDNIGYEPSKTFWLNWCPATNWEISGNVFYLSSKYDVLEAELQNFIPLLAQYFDLNVFDTRFCKIG